MNSLYAISKSLHLIGAFSWMAGIFYLVRIMVYHAESVKLPEQERRIFARQYNLMEWKAYKIILQPAVVLTWTFGVIMWCIQPVWLQQGWMHAKLLFLLMLTAYTHYCKIHIRRLESNDPKAFTHLQYRAMNEVPTVFMVAIIFLAVFKNGINWVYLSIGIVLFSGLIFSAVKKANRAKGSG